MIVQDTNAAVLVPGMLDKDMATSVSNYLEECPGKKQK